MLLFYYLTLIDNEDERQKFERIYHIYRNRMHYVASQILKDEHEAENIVHDAFITLIDYMDKIVEVESAGTWNYIVTILKNKCFNFLKRSKKMDFYDDGIPEEPGDKGYEDHIMDNVIQKEEVDILTQCIQKLKYPNKEVIYLYYYNNLNSKEIGQLLGLSAANVRKIVSRSKQDLKKILSEMGYEYEG